MYFYYHYFRNNHCKALQSNSLDGALYKKKAIIIILPRRYITSFVLQAGHLFDVVALSSITRTATLTKSSQSVVQIDIELTKYMIYMHSPNMRKSSEML